MQCYNTTQSEAQLVSVTMKQNMEKKASKFGNIIGGGRVRLEQLG